MITNVWGYGIGPILPVVPFLTTKLIRSAKAE